MNNKILLKQLIIVGILFATTFVGVLLVISKSNKLKIIEPLIIEPLPISTVSMIIASPAFKNNGYIPSKYTCDGLDINPPLRFANIPIETISLAIIISEVVNTEENKKIHWIAWNILPDINSIEENKIQNEIIEGKNNFKNNSYNGPCPCPSTTSHKYEFKLIALNSIVVLQKYSTYNQLMTNIEGHILAETKLTGFYER